MKKINLKNILKKTFKKKKTNKISTSKKKSIKSLKIQKKISSNELKKKQKKVIKDDKKLKLQKSGTGEPNLRLTKSATEQKPEIKKIKNNLPKKESINLKIMLFIQSTEWVKSANLKKLILVGLTLRHIF